MECFFLACYSGVHACVSESLCQEVYVCVDVQLVLKGYYRKAECLWPNYLKAERDKSRKRLERRRRYVAADASISGTVLNPAFEKLDKIVSVCMTGDSYELACH